VALLVGLPQNPSRLDPVAHPDLATKRRPYILKSLAGAGVTSDAEEARAAAENAEFSVVAKAGRAHDRWRRLDRLGQVAVPSRVVLQNPSAWVIMNEWMRVRWDVKAAVAEAR
jgi:membrane peptidoglycan carboxypeptidase